jgi:hypothetical protein
MTSKSTPDLSLSRRGHYVIELGRREGTRADARANGPMDAGRFIVHLAHKRKCLS